MTYAFHYLPVRAATCSGINCISRYVPLPLLWRDDFTPILHISLNACLQYACACLDYLGGVTVRGDERGMIQCTGVLYFHEKKRFLCLVMLDANPLKRSFDGDGGVCVWGGARG